MAKRWSERLGAGFGARTRLYQAGGEDELAGLLVESFSLREGLSEPFELQLDLLGLQVGLEP